MKRLAELAVLVVIALGAVWWSTSGHGEGRRTAGDQRRASPAGAAPVETTRFHGVAWQIHHSHDCVARARRVFREIADLGADTVLISNPGYQEHAGSDTFHLDPGVTPTREEWLEIFDVAREHRLRIVLMPMILLSDPRGTEWRGVIKPPNWDDWFEQYRAFLLHFARIAEEGGVDVFMVGSELVSTERLTSRWRRVIREVREVYGGLLSYSANWDHYRVVEFWDDLDLVGMTSYYKLSADPNPSLETLIDAWKPIRRGILRWQEQVGKPLLFTEVGWCSQEGASIEPWNYFYKREATPAGLEEQRRCYRAFMETWKDVPQVGGTIWWEWSEDGGGEDDYNYTPRGKPAEHELRRWFAAQARRADAENGP